MNWFRASELSCRCGCGLDVITGTLPLAGFHDMTSGAAGR